MQKRVARKKILMLTENFPPIPGGSGRWFWELYSRLPKDDILVLAGKAPAFDTEKLDSAAEIDILRLPLSSTEWGFKSFIGLRFYFKKVLQIRRIIKKYNITEIHCGRVIHEGVIALLLSKLMHLKYCCYIHGEDIETAAISREHNLMVKQVCKNADFLVCNSENSASIVKRLNYADNEKLHVLYPGVDAQRFKQDEIDLEFKSKMGWSDKFVILTVGRLQKRKGHHKMIEAMPRLLKEHPDALYVVIGTGECESALLKQSENLKMTENIQFLSELSDTDMIHCYQQCDLFILPNITLDADIEGFGMVLVEAQACGKPVVAGDSGGTRETMLVGVTGEIVDCNDPNKLATFLTDLLKNRERLKTMGVSGRKHVVSELDWHAHVKRAMSIFNLDED